MVQAAYQLRAQLLFHPLLIAGMHSWVSQVPNSLGDEQVETVFHCKHEQRPVQRKETNAPGFRSQSLGKTSPRVHRRDNCCCSDWAQAVTTKANVYRAEIPTCPAVESFSQAAELLSLRVRSSEATLMLTNPSYDLRSTGFCPLATTE